MADVNRFAAGRRWWLLAVVGLAQFMVLLDATAVALALPGIQHEFNADTAGVEWVVNAYVLCFGGLMLLGGRTADRWGRRGVLVTGVLLFSAASLACGAANGIVVLDAARALQGVGAALLSPTALSLVTTSFEDDRERNVALGVWAALSGLGGTLGVVLGGLVTDTVSWRWIFYLNLPVGAVVILGVLLLAPARSRVAASSGRPDLGGALLVTLGLGALVWGVVQVPQDGWSSPWVLGALAAAVVLLAGFVLLESRITDPLVPLPLFRTRSMVSSSVGRVLTAGVQAAVLFLGSFYLQRALLYSPLKAGLAFLPLGLVAVLVTLVIPRLMQGLGPRRLYAAGGVLSCLGLGWLAWAPDAGRYLAFVLPALLILGVAMQATTVPVNVVGIAEVPARLHGVASGVLTASFQIGTSLGIAAVAGPALTRVRDQAATGTALPLAWQHGLRLGFVVAVGIAVLNLINAVVAFPGRSAASLPESAGRVPVEL